MLMSWYISGFHTGNFIVLGNREIYILLNILYSIKREKDSIHDLTLYIGYYHGLKQANLNWQKRNNC